MKKMDNPFEISSRMKKGSKVEGNKEKYIGRWKGSNDVD